MVLRCPICLGDLELEGKTCRCGRNHSFDVARQGYVNLLPVQQKHSLNPGDTRQQVLARRAFLETGSYSPIVEAVIEAAKEASNAEMLLDVGCGEGYYASRVAEALNAELIGLDISKEAVRCAAAKYKNGIWLCGTAAHLPLQDECVDVLMSMFALTVPGEFARVLKQDGFFIQVLAAQDHLLGLKSVIYPEVFRRQKDSVPQVEGFRLVRSIPVQFEFTVCGEQVQNLLSMTPHFWRISAQGAQRLSQVEELTDKASAVVNLYQKTC